MNVQGELPAPSSGSGSQPEWDLNHDKLDSTSSVSARMIRNAAVRQPGAVFPRPRAADLSLSLYVYVLAVGALVTSVQARGEIMMARHGFLGVPTGTFEEGGRTHFIRLLQAGLQPDSSLLDIGCGCLRVGYWLIKFLDADRYCGVEPAWQRVEFGLQCLFEVDEVKAKRPSFDFNPRFDFTVFERQFDFFIAGSIWSHASKAQIGIMLDNFVRTGTPDAVLLASYIPATSAADDYQGDRWVGTSHESATAGVIRHTRGWVQDACLSRSLVVEELPGIDCDGQPWLKVRRS